MSEYPEKSNSLQRVGDRAQPRAAQRQPGAREGLVRQRGHGVGDQHLLAQAHHEAAHALREARQRLPALLDLGRDAVVAQDRARDQLGKEGDVQRQLRQAALRRDRAPVHVDGVGQGLEGVEGYPDGQCQRRDGRLKAEGLAREPREEAQILEHEQHAQVDHERQRHQPLADPGGGEALHAQAAQIVERDAEQHQQQVHRFAPGVEHQAEHQQPVVAQAAGQQVVDRQRDGQRAGQERQ